MTQQSNYLWLLFRDKLPGDVTMISLYDSHMTVIRRYHGNVIMSVALWCATTPEWSHAVALKWLTIRDSSVKSLWVRLWKSEQMTLVCCPLETYQKTTTMVIIQWCLHDEGHIRISKWLHYKITRWLVSNHQPWGILTECPNESHLIIIIIKWMKDITFQITAVTETFVTSRWREGCPIPRPPNVWKLFYNDF